MPIKKKKDSSNIERLKVGSTSFAIYPNNGSFTLAWSAYGKRIRKTFKTVKEAKIEARKTKITKERNSVTLTGRELNEYKTAVDLLNSFALMKDSPERLRIDTLINEALSNRKKQPEEFTPKSTVDIWRELYQNKKDLNRAQSTISGLNMVLSFTEMFPFDIHEITEQDILEWNTSIISGRAPRTVYNYQARIIEFFNYSQMMKYLPYGSHVANILTKKAVRSKKGVEEVHLWNIESLPTLLKTASRMRCKSKNKDVVIMIALAAFAGCRVSEISRITWENNVIWKTGYLRIPASVSKNNKAHRKVAISPTLEAWLRYAGADEDSRGSIAGTTSAKYVSKRLEATSKRSGLDHVSNGYRHTCISSWVATGVQIGEVGLRSDNSPSIIKSNYLGEITKEEGEQWHNTMPPT